MTAFLPPNLLALFAARDPIPYLPPVDKLGHEKKRLSYGGVAQFLKNFEDPKDTPPPTRVETKDERKERKRKERAEQIAYKLEQDLALWDPHSQITTDPYKSLFVARINYDTSESKIRREFEMYGPIRKIKVCSDKNNGKPRGYAFIEYEHERDMHSAYKHADGKKIDGRRVLVDVERGRTVKGWRPRRLGGGLGGTRKGGPDENTRFSGRDEYSGRDNAGGGYNRPERADRDESRDRDRGVERRRRTRSPRERGERGAGGAPDRERRRRSRSRDRKRDAVPAGGEDEERERERKKRSRRSSKSRDKDSKKRSRSRDRERKRRRSRSRDRKRKEGDAEGAPGGEPGEFGDVTIKEEPSDEGYPSYAPNGNGNQGNTEEEEGQYDGAPMGD